MHKLIAAAAILASLTGSAFAQKSTECKPGLTADPQTGGCKFVYSDKRLREKAIAGEIPGCLTWNRRPDQSDVCKALRQGRRN